MLTIVTYYTEVFQFQNIFEPVTLDEFSILNVHLGEPFILLWCLHSDSVLNINDFCFKIHFILDIQGSVYNSYYILTNRL
jgi:hypothetical protein